MKCKICRGPALPFGVVDFNKSCAERLGTFLAPAGVPVSYLRCSTCGFLFTTLCDGWSPSEFKERIYNDGYAEVDPDYDAIRPDGNAGLLARTFANSKAGLRVLDYGSGSGRFAAQLEAEGFASAACYDPISNPNAEALQRRYNIVTCFEVLEHHVDPLAAIRGMSAVLDPDGIVVHSTLVQGADFERDGLNWWYVGPRNGHISIFSRPALATAWATAGFQVASMNDDLHVAFRTIPDFARSLFAKV